MRVGFDLTPLCGPPTGVGVYTAQLFLHLHPLLEHHLVAFAHRHALWLPSSRPYSLLTPRWSLNKTLWMQCVLPWVIARAKVDICHFTNSVAPLMCPSPFVVTVHDASLWLTPEYHYPRRLIAMRPLIPLVVRRAAAVVTVSHSARLDLMRVLRVPRERIHVIYEAPAPHFRPLIYGEWVERVRRKYTLPQRFVLFVGTLEPRKNLERLIQAFAQVRQWGLPHKLVVVGQQGWKEQRIFALVEQLNLQREVHFVGYVPDKDLVCLYNLAEVFAFPSLYEGFGLPVVEAMACGTPVLTANRGALAEIAGPAAELVTPEDVGSIAEGLYRLLTDPELAAQRREEGLRWVRRFRWERTAQQTLRLYQSLHASPVEADAPVAGEVHQ